MAYKSKVVAGTPSTYSKVNNTVGWSRTSLGGDTVPGRGIGAPLVTTRRSDDSGVKSIYYADGIGPGAMTPHASTLGVLGGRSDDAPTHDSMARGPRAHP